MLRCSQNPVPRAVARLLAWFFAIAFRRSGHAPPPASALISIQHTGSGALEQDRDRNLIELAASCLPVGCAALEPVMLQYLAVAATLGCDLWTGDRRLVNAVNAPWVRWVGETGRAAP